MKQLIFVFVFGFILLFTTLSSSAAFSQPESQQESQDDAHQEIIQFSEAELAQMLAPIALYPDSLLTHILIAATYPIEIVEAHRWLKKNEPLNVKQVAQQLESFEWDASVKALVPFEHVLGRLSDDLSWTQQLGDAFLQDEARVLTSIQALREQAKRAGNLDKMESMAVSYEENNIVIEPIEREIVYVPYYDTRMVYGNWHWSSYPPVYWTPHARTYVSHYSPFYWHSGVHISFNYFFSAFHWHNRHVVVGNPHRSHHYRPRSSITRGGYAKPWAHQPIHRKGVAFRSKHANQKYQGNRANGHYKNKQLNSSPRNTHRGTTHRKIAQSNKTHQRIKHNLAIKSHPTTQRKAVSVSTKNRQVSLPNHQTASVVHSKTRRVNSYHDRKTPKPEMVRTEVVKFEGKNVHKPKNTASTKKQSQQSRGQKQPHRSSKSHQRNSAKTRQKH